MVLMFSVLGFQLAAPAAYALARALPNLVSKKRLETLVDRSIHGNATLTNLPNLNRNPSPRPTKASSNPHPALTQTPA